jgi:hypothetical protein
VIVVFVCCGSEGVGNGVVFLLNNTIASAAALSPDPTAESCASADPLAAESPKSLAVDS